MKLIKFNIKCFKSVLDLGVCEANEKVTVLAGKNESGKTNILEALFKLKVGEKFEEKEKTLSSEKNTEVEGIFKLDEMDIDRITQKIGDQHNLLFSEEQIDGFKKQQMLSIIKNQDDYTVVGDLYAGIIKIIEKDIQTLLHEMNLLNDDFKSKGKDLLSELKINTAEMNTRNMIRHAVNQFTNAVQNNIALLGNVSKTNIELSEIKTHLEKIEKSPTEENIKKIFISSIPNFVLFGSFDEEKIKDSMTFEEAKSSQFVKDLAKINNKLDMNEIIKKQGDEFWIQNFQEQFSASITRDFMDYWDYDKKDKINHVDIRIRVANGKISFFVSNPTTKQQLFPSQRSKGFQWFLSFYTRILSNTNDGEDNIILIDEPGLFLHAKAQKSVLNVLNKLSKNDQIIYSTHSPYLIEEDKLERIRLVEKDKEDHTHIVNKFYDTKDQDTLTPILTAIGHDIFSGITFDEKKNSVIVEGVSDYLIITAMLNHLDYKLEKKYIIPMKGANTIAKYIPFFIGWGLNFIIVVDNDAKGKEVEQELTEKWLVKEKQILHISKNGGESIEDLFTHKEYFGTLLGKDNYNEGILISEQLNDNQKVIAAKELQKKLNGGSIVLSDETKKRFSSLFKKIDESFKN